MTSQLVVAATITATLAAGLGVAFGSSLTVTSKSLSTSAAATPAMFPVSVSATDGEGHPGEIRPGDRIQFVWSKPVDEPSLCSSWSNTSSTQSISMSWVAVDGTTTHDVLQPGTASACATGMHVGKFDMGSSGYVNGNVTYSSSTTTLSVGASTTTLTVTLGNDSGGGNSPSSGTVGTWTPDAALTDRSGNNCGSNIATTTTTVMF